MHTVYLGFYGIDVQINTNSQDVLERISTDFSYFIKQNVSSVSFTVNIFFKDPPKEVIPPLKASSQSLNSITYDHDQLRYNDYYGEALSIYNYNTNQAEIYSLNLNRLHEIAYLLILSRTGEALDLSGFHKIHACGVSHRGCAFIMMMPMKGGKSTTFLNLLSDPAIEIISDDTPLIDRSGIVHAFPLRLGIGKIPNHVKIDQQYITHIKRELYGEKLLIDMRAFRNSISKPCKKVVLLNGVRYSRDSTQIVKCSKVKMVKPLLFHMVIGIGLPMILEYFLRLSGKDFFSKSRILFSRLYTELILLSKADLYTVELGKNQRLAYQRIAEFIENYNS